MGYLFSRLSCEPAIKNRRCVAGMALEVCGDRRRAKPAVSVAFVSSFNRRCLAIASSGEFLLKLQPLIGCHPFGGLHPAASASAAVQNQRLLGLFMFILPYQRSPGRW